MKLKTLCMVAFATTVFAALHAQAGGISLGSAETFGVLGGSTVTSTGLTTINGNLGVSPGTAITGFPDGVVTVGSIHAGDAVADQAHDDTVAAWNNIGLLPVRLTLSGQDLGGMTLTPGVYGFGSSAQLTGTLILDAEGDPDATFIFVIGSTLTTAVASSVLVINAENGCNVIWRVGSSATIGVGTAFHGSILASASVTLNTGASLAGRALAIDGAVTMDNNHVTIVSPCKCFNDGADINQDGTVDGADLGILLAAWNTNNCKADMNNDGNVDGADLGILLAAWSS